MIAIVSAVLLSLIYGVEGLTLEQSKKVWVKSTGKSVSFICKVTGLDSDDYVHWYHKKDGGTFKRLLYISESGSPTIEAKEFAAEKNGNSYEIKLHGIKKEHAGVYYCASWEYDGSHSDTKLIHQIQKP
ncbi:T-cell receptor gamma [Triplophysa rosa]|nr:T-cell receptor gamma [Triplophysa rosa]